MNVHFSSQRMNWKTPKKFYEELDKEFHFDESWKPIESFLDVLSEESCCTDMYIKTKKHACNCMRQWAGMSAQEKERVVDYLLNFALLKQDDQRKFLLELRSRLSQQIADVPITRNKYNSHLPAFIE